MPHSKNIPTPGHTESASRRVPLYVQDAIYNKTTSSRLRVSLNLDDNDLASNLIVPVFLNPPYTIITSYFKRRSYLIRPHGSTFDHIGFTGPRPLPHWTRIVHQHSDEKDRP